MPCPHHVDSIVALTKIGIPERTSGADVEWEAEIPGFCGAGRVDWAIGESVVGVLLREIEIGRMICIRRKRRNQLLVGGMFVSSEVVTIEPGKITTRNSVYRIEALAEDVFPLKKADDSLSRICGRDEKQKHHHGSGQRSPCGGPLGNRPAIRRRDHPPPRFM